MPRRHSPRSAQSVRAALRREWAARAKLQGLRLDAIAEAIKAEEVRRGTASPDDRPISKQAVSRLLRGLMSDALAAAKEDTESHRAEALVRLDRVHAAVWPQATKGDLGAVDRWLRIEQRRAELLGLDAPKRQDITQRVSAEVVRYEYPDNGRGPADKPQDK